MKPTDEYKASLSNATAFKLEYPEETATTAARIYNVNKNTVRTVLYRERQRDGPALKHGGHNKILSDIQVEAIYKYVEDSYLSGYGLTKAMVYAVVGCLKANQLLAKNPLTWRWFQEFMKNHPDLFRTLQTKPIAQVRVSAAGLEEVKD
jgi:hypothetical protein